MPNTNPNEISQEITPENLGDLTLFNNIKWISTIHAKLYII